MLSKEDIRALKEILFERINLLEESMTIRFNKMDSEIQGLKINLSSVQELAMKTNAYIETELKINLHQLEQKDNDLQRQIDAVRKG
jgi:hypothetical protein